MVQSFLGRVSKIFSGKSKRQRRSSYNRQRLGFETLEDKRLLTIVPSGFTETLVASALSSPTSLVTAHDGRVFIAQQNGVIRIVKNDGLSAVPFASLTTDSNGERGLLGITLDPNFDSNHYLYVFYTATSPSHMRISRLTANGDTVLPGSEQILMEFPSIDPDAIWRMGGALNFGPDGELYIGVGDEQNSAFSQSLDNPFGKILRINADGSIPTDNPFYNTTTGVNRTIWAYGLRNPFTTSFQPGTGRFFINDVGQSSWEEIDEGAAGRNFGWPSTEGRFTQSKFPNFTEPVYAYSHSNGSAITGGAFYNPNITQFPAQYVGQYFFNDFSDGEIRLFDPATGAVAVFAEDLSFPTNLSVSDDGSLYYLSRGIGTGVPGTGTGQVYKVQYASSTAPKITTPPANTLVPVGYGANFSVAVTGSSPFTYQWQRNGVNIPGATAATYNLASTTIADSGAQFRVVVTNSFGTGTSAAAVLAVTTQPPPTVEILSPEAGTTYTAGQAFHFVGKGTDALDGNLPDSRFVWQVDFHHDTHAHPFIPPTGDVSSLDFTIPTVGETSDEVWYRVYLTVTDSIGLSSTTHIDIHPVLSHISLNTNVPGMSLTLDGQPQNAPLDVTGVVGLQRKLSAPLTQTVGGVAYQFQSWSDGGAATHSIAFPSSDTTYTANYTAVSVTYLSDMPTTGKVKSGWGSMERDMSNGDKKAQDGQLIQLDGVTYLKGLGTNAASSATFNLAGAYTTFVSDVGVDDEVGSNGSVTFQVWGDGVLLFDGPKMTGESPTQTIALNVAGVTQLKLIVTDAGDKKTYDHADWANARLLAPPDGGSQTPPIAVSFASPVSYLTGANAHGVVSADLNGDSKPDLAVANSATSTVSVLLGNGDGTFASSVNYGVGQTPKAVTAADVNGDHLIDLVTADQDSATVSVLMNLGNGVFAPAVSYAATANAHDVALADLDGDGDVDIVETGWGAKFVRVLFNNGDGTFGGGADYGVAKAPHSVVSMDFNGDGMSDIAVADHDSKNVAVLINNGNGTFKSSVYYKVGSKPHMVRAGDLNGDGAIDLVTANEGSNTVSVLIGNGAGTFAKSVSYATGSVPKGVAIGDVNGDGRPDLVTVNTAGNYPSGNSPGGNTISLLLNVGQGKFAKPLTFVTGTTPFAATLADFDGNGKLDVATSNWATSDVTVLLRI